MIALIQHDDRYMNTDDDRCDADTYERIRCRRRREFPVRLCASRTRARKKSRGGAAARMKSRMFNGAHRRRRAA
jgi:hypothetical protein